MVNVAGGNRYALGDYHAANETWTTTVPAQATIDSGPDANWMAGQFAGDRFMNIGWSVGGPPMAPGGGVAEFPGADGANDDPGTEVGEAFVASSFRHITFISFYVFTEAGYRYTQRPRSADRAGDTNLGGCQYSAAWEVFDGYTNIYNREPSPTNETHGTLKVPACRSACRPACLPASHLVALSLPPFEQAGHAMSPSACMRLMNDCGACTDSYACLLACLHVCVCVCVCVTVTNANRKPNGMQYIWAPAADPAAC
jgi:hypothetical protein